MLLDAHTGMKTCSRCKEVKAPAYYQADASRRDGLSQQCKPCKNAIRSAWLKTPKGIHQKWIARYRRRARAYGLTPVVRTFTRAELVERYGDACVDCGGAWTDVDHVTPVSMGGPHTLDNCEPVCSACNSRRYWHGARAALDTPPEPCL